MCEHNQEESLAVPVNVSLSTTVVIDHTLSHLVARRMPAGEKLKLCAALFNEKFKRLDDYPTLVRIAVRLTQKRRRLRFVGQLARWVSI